MFRLYTNRVSSLKQRNVELKMQLLFIESYKLYIESMQKALLDVDTFFSPDELQKKHENMKYEAIEKVCTDQNWIQLDRNWSKSPKCYIFIVQER